MPNDIAPRSLRARVTLLATLAAVALVAAACDVRPAEDSRGATPTVTPTATVPGGEHAIHGEPETIEVLLGELFIRPGDLHVATGTDITLSVTNDGVIEHDLVVEGVGETPMLAAGQGAELQLGVLDAGTYTIYCSVPGHRAGGMEGTLTVSDEEQRPLTADEIDEMHLAGIAAFPAETEGLGNVILEPVMDGEVKVFELTASEIEWEVEPGKWRSAMAYNEMVPGPQIRVDLGDRVRIILHNEMSESTGMHFHHQAVPNNMDGVPGLTQPPVRPGESFTYEFTVTHSGSHMYHSHHNAAVQVPMGLLGAFVVASPDDEPVDQDIVMVLNDGPLGYSINGKGFPATEPIVARQGERIRIRYMNEGLQIHPMHLHGMVQQVIERDGHRLPQPYYADVVTVAPGERLDVIIEATELGAWAFHCHVLTHAESPHGMFGMVTVMIVEE